MVFPHHAAAIWSGTRPLADAAAAATDSTPILVSLIGALALILSAVVPSLVTTRRELRRTRDDEAPRSSATFVTVSVEDFHDMLQRIEEAEKALQALRNACWKSAHFDPDALVFQDGWAVCFTAPTRSPAS